MGLQDSYSGSYCPICYSTSTQDCVIPEMTIQDKKDRMAEYLAKKFMIDGTHSANIFEINSKRVSEESREEIRYRNELLELNKQYPDVEDK